MWRLADALGVALGTLLGEETVPVLHLTRRDEGAAFAAASGLRGRILSTARQEHRTEVMELVFDAAIRHESAGHAPGTEELLICTEGEIEAGPEGEEAQLDVGDAMWFPGDRRHYYRTQDTARAILLMVYPAVTRSILTSPPQTEIAPGLRRRRHA